MTANANGDIRQLWQAISKLNDTMRQDDVKLKSALKLQGDVQSMTQGDVQSMTVSPERLNSRVASNWRELFSQKQMNGLAHLFSPAIKTLELLEGSWGQWLRTSKI